MLEVHPKKSLRISSRNFGCRYVKGVRRLVLRIMVALQPKAVTCETSYIVFSNSERIAETFMMMSVHLIAYTPNT